MLKKKSSNKLYQAILYLAPGDYHRFHSPIDYDVLKRKVINGYLFSVSEENLLKRKKVYEKNARLVLHGKWK
jgi:phosphatidylserine decarboxylase